MPGRVPTAAHVRAIAKKHVPKETLTYKEVRRQSILSGLRVLGSWGSGSHLAANVNLRSVFVYIQVLATLINAIFALDYLKFTAGTEIDSLELFAGDCSVSRGETMDGLGL